MALLPDLISSGNCLGDLLNKWGLYQYCIIVLVCQCWYHDKRSIKPPFKFIHRYFIFERCLENFYRKTEQTTSPLRALPSRNKLSKNIVWKEGVADVLGNG